MVDNATIINYVLIVFSTNKQNHYKMYDKQVHVRAHALPDMYVCIMPVFSIICIHMYLITVYNISVRT